VEPTLYLTCGLPASGKTTRALQLEAAGGVIRLNADEWICDLYPSDPEAAARDRRRNQVERVQWQLVERLLVAGTSVVLDWGLWTREERALYRRRAEALGARVKVEFTDAPLEELQRRVADRNEDLPPGTFHISADEMNEFAALFERPTADELDPAH
jgi:predicted kinase